MTAPELLPSSFYMWGASEDCLTAGYWSFDPPTGGGNPTTRFVALVPGAAPEVAALIAEARREDAKLLLDAYKGVLVLMRMLDKAGLVAGASAADQISKRIVDAHPEFPGLTSLRALKETTHD